MNNDFIEAVYRPYGTVEHGWTTSQSVIWNTNGVAYAPGQSAIVKSRESGRGYVIGTRGAAAGVEYAVPSSERSAPQDFVEGAGTGEDLAPRSLYADQKLKAKRQSAGRPLCAGSRQDRSRTIRRDERRAAGEHEGRRRRVECRLDRSRRLDGLRRERCCRGDVQGRTERGESSRHRIDPAESGRCRIKHDRRAEYRRLADMEDRERRSKPRSRPTDAARPCRRTGI